MQQRGLMGADRESFWMGGGAQCSTRWPLRRERTCKQHVLSTRWLTTRKVSYKGCKRWLDSLSDAFKKKMQLSGLKSWSRSIATKLPSWQQRFPLLQSNAAHPLPPFSPSPSQTCCAALKVVCAGPWALWLNKRFFETGNYLIIFL